MTDPFKFRVHSFGSSVTRICGRAWLTLNQRQQRPPIFGPTVGCENLQYLMVNQLVNTMGCCRFSLTVNQPTKLVVPLIARRKVRQAAGHSIFIIFYSIFSGPTTSNAFETLLVAWFGRSYTQFFLFLSFPQNLEVQKRRRMKSHRNQTKHRLFMMKRKRKVEEKLTEQRQQRQQLQQT